MSLQSGPFVFTEFSFVCFSSFLARLFFFFFPSVYFIPEIVADHRGCFLIQVGTFSILFFFSSSYEDVYRYSS